MAKQLTDEEILAYNDKEPTAVQTRFADWLIDKLELEFTGSAKEAAAKEASFREAVRVATALRMIFQASPENQGAREETRAAKPAKAAKGKAKSEDTGDTPEETVPAKAKKAGRPPKVKPADTEDSADEAVAPQVKKSTPRKAARTGATAPF